MNPLKYMPSSIQNAQLLHSSLMILQLHPLFEGKNKDKMYPKQQHPHQVLSCTTFLLPKIIVLAIKQYKL